MVTALVLLLLLLVPERATARCTVALDIEDPIACTDRCQPIMRDLGDGSFRRDAECTRTCSTPNRHVECWTALPTDGGQRQPIESPDRTPRPRATMPPMP